MLDGRKLRCRCHKALTAILRQIILKIVFGHRCHIRIEHPERSLDIRVSGVHFGIRVGLTALHINGSPRREHILLMEIRFKGFRLRHSLLTGFRPCQAESFRAFHSSGCQIVDDGIVRNSHTKSMESREIVPCLTVCIANHLRTDSAVSSSL